MRTEQTLSLVLALVIACTADCTTSPRPNIVFFLADDLGYNDVSYHGSDQIPTPNIDAICYSGINFNNYYVTPMCTPSRIELMSGGYALPTGQGDLVLFAAETRALGTDVKLMPEYLKELGYLTHLVGKWHLGHYEEKYTPTRRGFCSFFGPYSGHCDYYSHTALERNPDPTANQSILWSGHDFRRDLDVAWDVQGQYATHLYTARALEIIEQHVYNDRTKPLYLQMSHTAPHAGNIWDPVQAPTATVEKFSDIADERRRKYAAMVSELDTSIGTVIQALDNAGMLDNTIIVFSSDNGGTNNPLEGDQGSNWPLRGMKNTMWQGGVRGNGCMWSSSLKRPGTTYEGLMKIVDWLPTLYAAVGGNVANLGKKDGISQWNAINCGGESPRTELLVHADRIQRIMAYIWKKWKLVLGGSYMNLLDAWYGESGRDKEYPLYSAESILNSKTAQAIGKYGYVVQSAEEIEQKRDLVSVKCPPPASNSTAPCSLCLYNLEMDPCEQHNIAFENLDIVFKIILKLLPILINAPPPKNTPWSLDAYPGNSNCTWARFGDPPKPTVNLGKICPR